MTITATIPRGIDIQVGASVDEKGRRWRYCEIAAQRLAQDALPIWNLGGAL